MKKNLIFVLTILVLSVCNSFAQEKYYSRLDYVTTRGEIRVGMTPEYVPFEYKNEKGEIVGFDVDIAKKLAEASGARLIIKEYKWDDLILVLRNREIDIIISGMTRTLKRALDINFSEPYFQTGQVAIIKIRNKDIKDYKDLNKKEVKIAVVKKTTGEEIAKKKLPNASFVVFKGETEASESLIAGKVDVFIFDKPFADFLITKHPELKILPEQLSYEYYAFAIDKGDPDFLRWLDYFIAELKLTGEYDTIYNKWFREGKDSLGGIK